MANLFAPDQKKVIFFDLNKTLIDPEQSFQQAFVETIGDWTARWLEPWMSADSLLETYQTEWNKRSSQRKRTGSPEKLQQECLAAALHSLPVPQDQALVRKLLGRIREMQHELPALVPGAFDLLAELSRYYRLGIISNGNADRLARTVERTGLFSLIPRGHLFSSLGKTLRKPNPALFRHAVKAMGVPAEQAVMVGDSWTNDAVPAVRSGMDAVWIHSGLKKKTAVRKWNGQKVIVIRHFSLIRPLFL